MADQIPSELVLEILPFLPWDSLINTASTSRRFRALSRSFLFAHLDVRPYVIDYMQNCLAAPPAKKARAIQEKIAFFASPFIAPLVRSLNISAEEDSSKRGIITHIIEFSALDGTHVVLDYLLERLSSFVSLKKFIAAQVGFTLPAMHHLSQIANGLSLRLFSCYLRSGSRAYSPLFESMKLKKLEIDNAPSTEAAIWFHMMQAEHLEKLVFDFKDLKHVHFLLPNLRVLSLDLNPHCLAVDVPRLAQFSTIEVFSFYFKSNLDIFAILGGVGPMNPTPALLASPTPFPNLVDLTGPTELLPIFSRASTLRHLDTGRDPKSAREFSAIFRRAKLATNLTRLTLELILAKTPVADLHALLNTQFPVLEQLVLLPAVSYVEVQSPATVRKTIIPFYSFISNALPRSLLLLEITAEVFHPKADGKRPAADAHAIVPQILRDSVLKKCPKLKRMNVEGPGFALIWETDVYAGVLETNKIERGTT
uniref:F-box domain-containing protein n=1 Tax=Mycena chlorophos TaxID=658473 RepID=A0ABQ0L284_MYCCL|nr:predicted protein [Mycena chlorophos]